ncbi:MAG TPA: glycosyltransferase family 2 protein [Verrucomicrobiae bacterium]|nr:glycosyltransferase family 2 protein [Verrucomicrobiae bacterium]
MLSVLIPTLNEQENIAQCIQSVHWAGEIVVVDSGSTDDTVAIAQSLGATVENFDWNGRLPKKKNWALRNLSWENEWLLILDADERVPPELGREIRRALISPQADGFLINRCFVFLGRRIRHCGYFPSWNLRLFRHEKGQFEYLHPGDTQSGDNEIHEHLVLRGTTSRLQHEMLHFAYPDIFTWMDKHNRYSNWEAHVEVAGAAAGLDAIGSHASMRRRIKRWSYSLPCRSWLRFFYSYVVRAGFLDGYEGLVLCRLLGMYEALAVFKAHELRTRMAGKRPQENHFQLSAQSERRKANSA